MTIVSRPESLFRNEFTQQVGMRIEGDVWIGVPFAWKIVVTLLTMFILAAVFFAFSMNFEKKQSVQGRLVMRGGIISLVAHSGGQVAELKVKEGQYVEKNMLIASLSRTQVLNYEASNSSEIVANAEAKVIYISEKQVLKKILARNEAPLKKQRLALEEHRLVKIDVAANLKCRLNSSNSDIKRMEGPYTQVLDTLSDLDVKKIEVLIAQQSVLQTDLSLRATKQQVDDLTWEIRRNSKRLMEPKGHQSIQVAVLNEKFFPVTTRIRENIVAPISGIITAIPVELGQTLSHNTVVALLTPSGTDLEAELFIPSKAIGLVKVGHEVALHFQAFPYRRYGSGHGRIRSVSKTVLSPKDSTILGTTLQEPVFRVNVVLSEQTVRANGENIDLQPGMLLDANIVLERGNLLNVLFDRFLTFPDHN